MIEGRVKHVHLVRNLANRAMLSIIYIMHYQ